MKFIERLCMAFYGACILIEIRWVAMRVIAMLGWENLTAETWASWVQAVGSIVAIAGAYFIGERQAKSARRAAAEMQDRERSGKLASIFAICTAAHERAKFVYKVFCEVPADSITRSFDYDHSLVRSVIKALEAIPVHEIGNANAVIALLDIRDQLEFMIKAIDTPVDPSDMDYEDNADLKKQRREIWSHNIAIHVKVIDYAYQIIKKSIGANQLWYCCATKTAASIAYT